MRKFETYNYKNQDYEIFYDKENSKFQSRFTKKIGNSYKPIFNIEANSPIEVKNEIREIIDALVIEEAIDEKEVYFVFWKSRISIGETIDHHSSLKVGRTKLLLAKNKIVYHLFAAMDFQDGNVFENYKVEYSDHPALFRFIKRKHTVESLQEMIGVHIKFNEHIYIAEWNQKEYQSILEDMNYIHSTMSGIQCWFNEKFKK